MPDVDRIEELERENVRLRIERGLFDRAHSEAVKEANRLREENERLRRRAEQLARDVVSFSGEVFRQNADLALLAEARESGALERAASAIEATRDAGILRALAAGEGG